MFLLAVARWSGGVVSGGQSELGYMLLAAACQSGGLIKILECTPLFHRCEIYESQIIFHHSSTVSHLRLIRNVKLLSST